MTAQRTIGILGLGIFGSTLAETLANYGIEVIACDINQKNVDRISHSLTVGGVGDFTDLDYLKSLGFAQCDTIVISTGSSLESSVLGLVNAKELGVDRIICKVKNKSHRKVLTALGADLVLQPEKESAKRMATTLLRHSIDELIKLDSQTSIVEFHAPKRWLGKSLDSLDLRNRYDINIIGIRRGKQQSLITNFPFDYCLSEHETYVAVADNDKFEKADYLESIR